MIVLYSAEVCPFAQRTRALLRHLDVGFEKREIDLGDRDPEFLAKTPTGKVPLLVVDRDERLWESTVINEYLAEKHGHGEALSPDPLVRARERLAMHGWDDAVLPAFYGSLRDPDAFDAAARKRVGRTLDEILRTLIRIEFPVGNLLSFHCAPFWARMDWLRGHSPVPETVDERPMLRRWLDRAVAQPAVQETLPDRDETVRRYLEVFGGGGR